MRFSEEAYIFGGFVIASIIAILTSTAFDYWNQNQIRSVYQQAYSKNSECRAMIAKSNTLNAFSSVDSVCGPIPKFEDYVK